MCRALIFVATAVVLFPHTGATQETRAPLAMGDSIQIALEGREGPLTWTGLVRELRNPRDCLFLLVRSHEGSELDNVAFSIEEEFSLVRLAPDSVAFEAADLKAQGIQCIEAYPTPDEIYLNLEPDSARREGA